MSITTVTGIITVKAPQYATDPRLSDMIDLAKLQTSTCYGDKYNLAVALLVCHWLALETRNGGDNGSSSSGSGVSGALQSEKEGDLSRTYASTTSSSSSTSSSLSSTTYGEELILLRKGTFMNPRTRLMSTCNGNTITY